jgi:hypothetical protein
MILQRGSPPGTGVKAGLGAAGSAGGYRESREVIDQRGRNAHRGKLDHHITVIENISS